MNPIAARLADELPEGQVLSNCQAEAAWALCERVPQAVVLPETEDEVAQILGMASEHGWRCVPRGRGTWGRGGQPPDRVDVVVAMTRMDHVLAHEPSDLVITTESGIGLDLLARRARRGRQWLPLDPPGATEGSLGATIGTASAGPLQAGFGTPRDHVLGATLVTGDGRLLRLGGRVVKNVAGFDLLKLVPGSWGTLGIITSLTTRLHPLPAFDRTLLFGSSEISSAALLARAIAAAPVTLAAVEMLTLEREDSGFGREPRVAVRILESVAAAEEVDRIVCREAGRTPLARLEGRSSQAFFDDVRAMESGAELVLRLSLLPSRLSRLVEAAAGFRDLAEQDAGWGMRMAAHVHTGILRVMIARLGRSQGWLDRVVSSLASVRRSLEAEGGGLVVSEGPPEIVRTLGAWGTAHTSRELMRNLQREFDPAQILSATPCES